MTEEAIITENNEQNQEACVFMLEEGTCDRLVGTVCPVGGCSFKRLPSGEEERRAIWAKRLCSLEESKQKEISKKYYGGGRPWRENQ